MCFHLLQFCGHAWFIEKICTSNYFLPLALGLSTNDILVFFSSPQLANSLVSSGVRCFAPVKALGSEWGCSHQLQWCVLYTGQTHNQPCRNRVFIPTHNLVIKLPKSSRKEKYKGLKALPSTLMSSVCVSHWRLDSWAGAGLSQFGHCCTEICQNWHFCTSICRNLNPWERKKLTKMSFRSLGVKG